MMVKVDYNSLPPRLLNVEDEIRRIVEFVYTTDGMEMQIIRSTLQRTRTNKAFDQSLDLFSYPQADYA